MLNESPNLQKEKDSAFQHLLPLKFVLKSSIWISDQLSNLGLLQNGRLISPKNLFVILLGSHSELIKDPIGAYSQLIRFQEVNKDSKEGADDQNRYEISTESFRQSSLRNIQRISFQQSSNRASLEGSSRHSFSVTAFGLPTEFTIPNKRPAEIE